VPQLVDEGVHVQGTSGERGQRGEEADGGLGAATRVEVGRDEQCQQGRRRDGDLEIRHRLNLDDLGDPAPERIVSVSDQQTVPERPASRYQRTVAGGVGSMIVLIALVLAFVVFRGVFRDNGQVEQEPVDYLAAVQAAQQAGADLVYPPTLPKGWTATSIAYHPGERPAWGIGMLTDDGRFAGVRQEDTGLETMLEKYVDADPVEGDTVTIDSPLAQQWQEWSDAGGDHAYAASYGDDEVLVFGSASTDDLRAVVESLTDAPVS
jgi:hypothetical protein